MKLLEHVLLPETLTYVDERFGKQPRLSWHTESVPRLTAWLIGKKTLFANGEVREYGITGIQVWPALAGLTWSLWSNGAVLWPWLLFVMLLIAAVTRDAAAGVAGGLIAFGITAAAFYAGRAAAVYLGLSGSGVTGCGAAAVCLALMLLHRSIARFEPSEIPNYNGEPTGRRV